ncbi:MAG: Response regulators consisting of a CheY-like receiver domain and a winged-helix DNA-binding domain, partial [uncultured Rubellimicrobium sp.]
GDWHRGYRRDPAGRGGAPVREPARRQRLRRARRAAVRGAGLHRPEGAAAPGAAGPVGHGLPRGAGLLPDDHLRAAGLCHGHDDRGGGLPRDARGPQPPHGPHRAQGHRGELAPHLARDEHGLPQQLRVQADRGRHRDARGVGRGADGRRGADRRADRGRDLGPRRRELRRGGGRHTHQAPARHPRQPDGERAAGQEHRAEGLHPCRGQGRDPHGL